MKENICRPDRTIIFSNPPPKQAFLISSAAGLQIIFSPAIYGVVALTQYVICTTKRAAQPQPNIEYQVSSIEYQKPSESSFVALVLW
jgi:hypothetical protein